MELKRIRSILGVMSFIVVILRYKICMRNWTEYQNFSDLWGAIQHERKRRGSPLRTPTVATHSHPFPKQRTMVLRGFDLFQLVFFTDQRSDKCQEVRVNPNVSVHCYSIKHRVQIQFHGLAKLNESHPLFKHWKHTALQNPMDYSTIEAPGTLTDHCDTPQYDTTLASQHFIPMLVDIQEVHLLLLGTPHQRCRWVRMTNNTWLKEWLVP